MNVSVVVCKYGLGNTRHTLCYTDDGHPAIFNDPADAELLRAQLADRDTNGNGGRFIVVDAAVLQS